MNRLYRDAFDLLCGEQIGSGVHRETYACRLDPSMVVKVEIHSDRDRSFANVHEKDFWTTHAENHAVARWLAPCDLLSPDGRILLQRRAQPLPGDFQLPRQLPGFLTDIKRANFGLLQGKLVCVDYAYTDLTAPTRLKVAHWN